MNLLWRAPRQEKCACCAKQRRLRAARIKTEIEESPGGRLRQTVWRRARLSRVDCGGSQVGCGTGAQKEAHEEGPSGAEKSVPGGCKLQILKDATTWRFKVEEGLFGRVVSTAARGGVSYTLLRFMAVAEMLACHSPVLRCCNARVVALQRLLREGLGKNAGAHNTPSAPVGLA